MPGKLRSSARVDRVTARLAEALTGLLLAIYEVDPDGETLPEDHLALVAAREALEEVEWPGGSSI